MQRLKRIKFANKNVTTKFKYSDCHAVIIWLTIDSKLFLLLFWTQLKF